MYVVLLHIFEKVIAYNFIGLEMGTEEEGADLVILVKCACQNLEVAVLQRRAVGTEQSQTFLRFREPVEGTLQNHHRVLFQLGVVENLNYSIEDLTHIWKS